VKLDVLIPTYPRPAALAVTLTGLCAQSFRSFRVIVSDQSDGGASIRSGEVRAVARVLEQHGCEMRLHEHLPRRGIAEQRQFLLECSSAPYVLYLDDDVLLEPFVLGLMLDVIEREGCAFVGSSVIGLSFANEARPEQERVELWEGPVRPEVVVPGSREWERWKLHSAANLYHVQNRLGATPDAPLRYRIAWASACVLYEAAKLREVGGFSFWERLPPEHCGEDIVPQLELMRRYGGCGIMPSGAYHLELPTTIPRREVGAERVLGWHRHEARSV